MLLPRLLVIKGAIALHLLLRAHEQDQIADRRSAVEHVLAGTPFASVPIEVLD
jgi:hypothetical protein